MIRKKRGMAAGKQNFGRLIAIIGVVSALWGQPFVSLADSTGTVTADSATIRKETSTDSAALGSAAGGTTVTITDEVQDSAGTLWYQVSVNGQTGYIRSDLVSKTDDTAGAQSDGSQTPSGAQSDGSQIPPGATVEPDTVLDARYATVSADKIKVRTAPSTSVDIVDNLSNGDQVIVSGETQGNDGKKWYFVIFTGTAGSEKSGFIRSDLLSLGDPVPVPEEETSEPQAPEPEPEAVVNYDYELTYEQASDGTYVWYIYDYTDKEHTNQYIKYPLEELMKVTKARSEEDAANAKKLVRQRIAIVVLGVLLALLIGVAVVMALKLRDIYYENDEDEEEEETPRQRRRRMQEVEEDGTQRRRRTQEAEEDGIQRRRRTREAEDEEAPTRRRRRTQEDEETPTRRRRRVEEAEETPTRRRRRLEDSERDQERSVRRRSVRDDRENDAQEVEYHEDEAGSIQVKTTQKRKTKNFLLDDDEFEFEFLNVEDKN